MNVQRGLERMSMVWWGFWMLVSVGFMVGGLFSNDGALVGGGTLGVIGTYAVHRAFCWVLAGFFAPPG